MSRLNSHRLGLRTMLTACVVAIGAADCPAIEMFTYFGDGSRIGLPSLEVPIEAYPGIPLRSDRLRARRRAMRLGPGAAVPVAPPGYARGITVRSMPTQQAAPLAQPRSTTKPLTVVGAPEAVAPSEEPLVAPEPLDVGLPSEVTPPSGS